MTAVAIIRALPSPLRACAPDACDLRAAGYDCAVCETCGAHIDPTRPGFIGALWTGVAAGHAATDACRLAARATRLARAGRVAVEPAWTDGCHRLRVAWIDCADGSEDGAYVPFDALEDAVAHATIDRAFTDAMRRKATRRLAAARLARATGLPFWAARLAGVTERTVIERLRHERLITGRAYGVLYDLGVRHVSNLGYRTRRELTAKGALRRRELECVERIARHCGVAFARENER